ncbi:MAG TPA: LysR family transcriptional regulator, partial [Planctomycetota bacterium]|nr:LysR family transcriptional regulator [Planctomycetota bacterium]
MELDQLRAFLAVADAGGFSRAARVMASTQPTLSRQIGALERELGRPLLHRGSRAVQLTDFGRRFERGARALLSQADALAALAGPAAPAGRDREVTGELRLGVADSVILGRFPKLVERLARRHARLAVQITTGTSPEILAWVRNGRCDAGLCMLPRAHPGLRLRPVWTDRFVAIVPPRHALAGRRAELADLAAEHLIVIRPGTLAHQVLAAAWQAAGLSLVAELHFDNFQLIAEFVAAGAGVGLCSETVAAPYLAAGRVARVRVAPIDRLV